MLLFSGVMVRKEGCLDRSKRKAEMHKMWWVYSKNLDYSLLANIFIPRKVQVSSVYHNYFGLLDIDDLLQISLVLKIRVKPQYVEI